MNQQNKTERWEEKFDKNFRISDDKYGRQRLCEAINLPVSIKLFISQLLSDARREERERCLEALPKKQHFCRHDDLSPLCCSSRIFDEGFNDCIDQAISAISNKK